MNRLEQIIKEEIDNYLLEQQLIEEGLGEWFKKKIEVVKDKAAEIKKSGVREGYETVLAAKILLNIIKNKDASPEEVKFLKSQAADLAKVVTLLGLQPVPGNNIIIKLLDTVFKKFNIPFSFYPSSHTSDNNKDVLQKAYPDKELFEALLDETHTAQKDLEKLTYEILMRVAEYLLIQKMEGDNLTNQNFPTVTLDAANPSNFKEIDEFLEEVNFPIYFQKNVRGGARGALVSYNNGVIDSIEMRLDDNVIEDLKQVLSKDDVDNSDLYHTLFYPFSSTLLHELQHAYDVWRSKGRAVDGQDTEDYKKIQSAKRDVQLKKKDLENLTPEEVEAYNKGVRAYLNLQHEINARFAQAVAKIGLVDIDFDSPTFDTIKADWNRVYGDFKTTFEGWRHLSDKMKKKLTRRLAKAYQEQYEMEMEKEKNNSDE